MTDTTFSWFSNIFTTVSNSLEQATATVVTTFAQIPDVGEHLSKVDVPQVSLPDLTFPDIQLSDVSGKLDEVFSEVSLPVIEVPKADDVLDSLSKVPETLANTTDDAKKFFGDVFESFNKFVTQETQPSVNDVFTPVEPLVVEMPVTPVTLPVKKAMVKLLLIGDDQTGKSALLHRWMYNKFNENYQPTTGADFLAKEVMVDNKKVTVQIWDTSGQERFRSLGIAFYRGSDACIIVCDFARGVTVDHLEKWREEFIAVGKPKDPLQFPFFVIGNKSDMEPEAESLPRRISSWCSGYNIPCFFLSAKEGGGSIEEAFMAAVRKALDIQI